jgi:hypothetical protein
MNVHPLADPVSLESEKSYELSALSRRGAGLGRRFLGRASGAGGGRVTSVKFSETGTSFLESNARRTGRCLGYGPRRQQQKVWSAGITGVLFQPLIARMGTDEQWQGETGSRGLAGCPSLSPDSE